MKKFSAVFSLFLILSLLSGCTGPGSGIPDDGKLTVITSFYEMYDFACKIGGDKIHVVNLTPAGVEPHDWEPSPSDIVSLEKADVFIYNGAGMESWVDSVLASLGNKNLAVVKASSGIPLLNSDGEKSQGTSNDPHVWLNPQNAKAEMKAILDALVEKDPDNAAYYEDNYSRYAQDLDTLDGEFRDALAVVPFRNIVVAHQAFSYLCSAYDLHQVAIEGLAADSEPDAARMGDIIDFARSNHVKVIFFEELVSPKVAKVIAEESGCTTAVLNPLEGMSAKDQADGKDYFSAMRENLAELVKALS